MSNFEPFDGTQSWPVWKAAAEERMTDMQDGAKIEYMRSKLAGIYKKTCEIASQDITGYK